MSAAPASAVGCVSAGCNGCLCRSLLFAAFPLSAECGLFFRYLSFADESRLRSQSEQITKGRESRLHKPTKLQELRIQVKKDPLISYESCGSAPFLFCVVGDLSAIAGLSRPGSSWRRSTSIR